MTICPLSIVTAHADPYLYGISARDLRIIQNVSQFRITTAVQLQRMHYPGVKHATELTAIRSSRRTFERLVIGSFLARLDRRVGGARSGSASYCYVLGERGYEVLGLSRSRRREPSMPFLQHVLAVAELATELYETALLDGHVVVQVMEAETTCWRQFMGLGGGTDIVKPDLYVQLAVATNGNAAAQDDPNRSIGEGETSAPNVSFDQLYWFIEVDRGTEHRPAIQKKLRAYERYYQSGNGEGASGVFPRVLWSVDAGSKTEQRVAQLKDWIALTNGITKELFVVQAFDQSIKELKGGEL
jgi:hypothetical protein